MEPETVHPSGVSERNDTVSPVCLGGDVVVTDAADNVTGWPTAAATGWSKVIVWGADPARARNARATSGAGAKVPSPPWVAVMTQKPGAVGVAMEPETVQWPVCPSGTTRAGRSPQGAAWWSPMMRSM